MAQAGISRRRVLKSGLAAAGGVLAAALLPSALLFTERTRRLAELAQADFAAVVGSTFRVGSQVPLRLLSVTPLRPPAGGLPARGEGFTLAFGAPAGASLGEGILPVEHVRLGRFEMFLAPVGPPGPEQRYEAVFNRLWS